jgi:hypothetical protein
MKKIIVLISLFSAPLFLAAQDGDAARQLNYDPHAMKVIPDKVFEFGIPMLLIFLFLNTIVVVLKNRAEHQLKLKMIDKGVSEESLVKIFRESNAIVKLQPLKWFLFALATGVALLIIHLSRSWLASQSGYLAVSILLLCNAAAFFTYYKILSKKA